MYIYVPTSLHLFCLFKFPVRCFYFMFYLISIINHELKNERDSFSHIYDALFSFLKKWNF